MVWTVETVAGAFNTAHGMLPTAWRCAPRGLGGTADFGQQCCGWPHARPAAHLTGW